MTERSEPWNRAISSGDSEPTRRFGSDGGEPRCLDTEIYLPHPHVVAIAELGTPLELDPHPGVLRGLRPGRLQREEAREHRVDGHDQTVEREDEVLAAMDDRAERATNEEIAGRL